VGGRVKSVFGWVGRLAAKMETVSAAEPSIAGLAADRRPCSE
jgi:hypothetical protein